MTNILSTEEIAQLSKQLKSSNQKLVLVGGCFDILHPGHIHFLTKAKNLGSQLIVFLEPDQKIAAKDSKRPIFKQKIRAEMLVSLKSVDFVVTLPLLTTEEEYNQITKDLSPNIIATTEGDLGMHHIERTAELVDAKIEIIPLLEGFSTTAIIKQLVQLVE